MNLKSLRDIVAILAFLSISSAQTDGDKTHRAECLMWSKLENKTLPLQNQGHANCTTNDMCTGFDCKGVYKDKELSFGMRVLPCQSSPGVEIYGYAPQFNTKRFSHVFTHESEYRVPGALLNLSLIPGAIDSSGQEVEGRLEVHIKKNPDGKSLMMGLMMKACINNQCILSKPVFNHTEIPVPECTHEMKDLSKKVSSLCSMNELNACGENQICVQNNEDDSTGTCGCLRGFVAQDDGSCVTKTEDEVMTKKKLKEMKSKQNHNEHVPQPHVAEGSSGAVVAAIVVSVLVVLAILGVGVFVVLRTRLAPRLRARLTSTPYEDIVIGKQGRSESTQNVIA